MAPGRISALTCVNSRRDLKLQPTGAQLKFMQASHLLSDAAV
jgi:hypothetical protein